MKLTYEIARKLAQLSYKHWISYELFSFGWVILIIVNLIFYIIWFKLLDKKRIRDLLLIGSLTAVVFLISDIFIYNFFGFVEYNISLTPADPPVFSIAVTVVPIINMLVQQYMSSWKGYLLWISVGMAFLAFVILPIYSLIGILQLHNNWNYFYHFLFIVIGSVIARVAFLWIVGIEKRHSTF